MRTDLLPGEAVDPHPRRAQDILRKYPEIRTLFGRDRQTAGISLLLVAAQIIVTYVISFAPWWVALMAAWAFGAFLNHALFAVLHETTHERVFRSRVANQAVALLANLPMILPFAAPLAHYHRVHHRRMGQEQSDPDLPTPWEVGFFRGGVGRKLLWMALFPFLQLQRHARLDPFQWTSGFFLVGLLVQSLFMGFLVGLGWSAVLYLAASLYFVFAIHPLFGRFIQEHYVRGPGVETTSYVGPLNAISLNLGLHTEHHDFPAVPWSRLGEVRRLAAADYDSLPVYTSWWKLCWEFLMDPAWQVSGRQVRSGEG